MKIVDNTFVSYSTIAINGLDLIDRASSRYQIIIPKEVAIEWSKARWTKRSISSNATTVDGSAYPNYTKLFRYISKRYPVLGDGEISAICNYLLMPRQCQCYIILDDMAARKAFVKLVSDPEVCKLLSTKITCNYYWTTEFIERLEKYSLITTDERRTIANDLDAAKVRIPQQVLSRLKN